MKIFLSKFFCVTLLAISVADLKSQSPIVALTSGYLASGASVAPYKATPAPNSGTFAGCPNTNYNYSYSNGTSNILKLTGITTNGKSYSLANRPAVLKLRRVNNAGVTGQRSIVWLESITAPTACPFSGRFDFKSAYQDVMETFLNNSIINQGTDNIFTNASNSDGNNNNIERVDLIFPGGISSISATDAGFALFDRGNNNAHDPFKIAAITSLDVNGNPASFGAVKICVGGNGTNNGSYGHPSLANGNQNLLVYVMRKEAIDLRLKASAAINQQLGGVFFTFADLGIPAGQTIYGYALIGPDGIANPTSAELLNINDASVYPTNTTEAVGGGLDLIAVNALFISGPVLASMSSTMTANTDQQGVRLDWQLNGAEVNSPIEIERSSDGINFITIHSELAHGIFDEGSYHNNPAAGIYYYRIKTDIQNQVYYGEVVKVRVGLSQQVKIYPTIIQKGAQITVEGLNSGIYHEVVVSPDGKQMAFTKTISGSFTSISLPNACTASGIYFIYFIDANHKVSNVSKIIVQ